MWILMPSCGLNNKDVFNGTLLELVKLHVIYTQV